MTFSSTRVAFSVCLLVGFMAGCGSRQSRPEPGVSQTVTSQDIERNAGQSIEQILQSKAPGILVTRTDGGGVAIQIRGVSSFQGSNQPLYVIDDVPMEAGPGGVLTGVDPYAIESIKVLKNPADTGVYGVRGANGVLLIKMKKPARARRP